MDDPQLDRLNYCIKCQKFFKNNDKTEHCCLFSFVSSNKDDEQKFKQKTFLAIRHELYETERSYLNFLKVLEELFFVPLSMSTLCSEKEALSIFTGLPSIIGISKMMLNEIESAAGIQSIFNVFSPYLKLYSTYACNYSTSQKHFLKLMSKPKFRRFIEQLESDPRCNSIKLAGLLIMPIQRISRYELFIKRFLENSNNESERADLYDVLHQLQKISEVTQECLNDFEFGEKLWLIQESLGMNEGIVAPGRKFIKDGLLYKKVQGSDSNFEERLFWLFNDLLIYGKRRLGIGPKYECSCMLPLRHCSSFYDDLTGTIKIQCKSYQVLLTADSFDVLKKWHEELDNAIQSSKLSRSTLRKESSKQQVKEFGSQIRKKITNRFNQKSFLAQDTIVQKNKTSAFRKRKWESHVSTPLNKNGCEFAEKIQKTQESPTISHSEIKKCLQYSHRETDQKNEIKDEKREFITYNGITNEICQTSSESILQRYPPNISSEPPWWLHDSTPAVYLEQQKRGLVSKILDNCTIM